MSVDNLIANWKLTDVTFGEGAWKGNVNEILKL